MPLDRRGHVATMKFWSAMAAFGLGIIFTSVVWWALTAADPLKEITPAVQNIHNFIRRDIFLANEMTPSWDIHNAVDTQNDTLIIRFSSIDSVRYYVDDIAQLWREDALLLKNVWQWRARLLSDSTSYEIFIALGDPENPISYEWIIIPRIQTP